MGQKLTTEGINWERIREEDYDALAAIVEDASKACDGTLKVGVRTSSSVSYYAAKRAQSQRHETYEAIDGSTRCLSCPINAIWRHDDEHPGKVVKTALANSLGTTRKAIFADKVKVAA